MNIRNPRYQDVVDDLFRRAAFIQDVGIRLAESEVSSLAPGRSDLVAKATVALAVVEQSAWRTSDSAASEA